MKYESPENNEHQRAIGQITINFTLLELVVERYISDLIDPLSYGAGELITAEMAFYRKQKLLSCLFKHKHKDDSEFDKLMKKVDSARRKRNSIAHSIWQISDSAEALLMIEKKMKNNKIKKEKTRITVRKLDNIADFIGGVAVNLSKHNFQYYPIIHA